MDKQDDCGKKLSEKPYYPFVLAFIILSAIIIFLMIFVYTGGLVEFEENLIPNLCASLVDIVLLGVLVSLVSKKQNDANEIKLWKREIEAYSDWKEEEGVLKKTWLIKNLVEANVNKLDLRYIQLENADLSFIKLPGAILCGSNLSGAYLKYTDLCEADLREANLSEAKLYYTCLWKANLEKADFSGANLYLAGFDEANLDKANFSGADLYSAILRNAKNLTVEQLLESYSLYMTDLDNKLLKRVIDEYPELLANRYNEKNGKWNIDQALLERIKKDNWEGWEGEEKERPPGCPGRFWSGSATPLWKGVPHETE